MPHRRIGPAPKSSVQGSSGVSGPPSGRRPLPPDLVRDASRRLGIVGLLAATLWVVGTILYHVFLSTSDPFTAGGMALGSDAFVVPGFLSSIALYFYSRHSTRDPRFIFDLGLAYMVFTALLLGLMFHWDSVPPDWRIIPMITWTGAITVIFAAIVPSTPLKTFIAGVIAVSMNPIGMLVARARGVWNFDPASDALMMHYPDYLLVGVSVVISHVLTNLGQQVAKAREMGSYELGALLGKGGMGEVYKAKHRMLARPAAIKLIRPEVIAARGESAEVAIARFRREADIAARLRSPHTVALYDFGVSDDETLYLVMEFLEGMTLETLVRKTGPVSTGRAVFLLTQICDSLEEAHAYNLVHRDIKPANIHVGRVGLHSDFVKVLDFGLAKAIGAMSARDGGEIVGETIAAMITRGAETGLHTNAAALPGTPAYMAPEMLTGQPIDGRSDIYAVGCVAYFLLTGNLVFEGTTVMHVLAQHLSATPIPPSQRTELPVPGSLDALVLSCLAKDPAERPQSAAELAAKLAAIKSDSWDEELASRWWLNQ
jgi:serine/threonine-protein kinase